MQLRAAETFPARRKKSARRSILRVASLSVLALLVALVTCWSVLALYYFDPLSALAQTTLAALFGILGLVTVATLYSPSRRAYALVAFAVAFFVLLACWSSIAPSNTREWKPGVAAPPEVRFVGRRITIHNIRNFDYRTESNFAAAYYAEGAATCGDSCWSV